MADATNAERRLKSCLMKSKLQNASEAIDMLDLKQKL